MIYYVVVALFLVFMFWAFVAVKLEDRTQMTKDTLPTGNVIYACKICRRSLNLMDFFCPGCGRRVLPSDFVKATPIGKLAAEIARRALLHQHKGEQ